MRLPTFQPTRTQLLIALGLVAWTLITIAIARPVWRADAWNVADARVEGLARDVGRHTDEINIDIKWHMNERINALERRVFELEIQSRYR